MGHGEKKNNVAVWPTGIPSNDVINLVDGTFNPRNTPGHAISPNVLAELEVSKEAKNYKQDHIAILNISGEKPSLTTSSVYRYRHVTY